ncbi:MAG: hypothetical protein IPL83_08105 [Bdellovibrionales bacterium]|nr:hypothetical protein [Bdellovibrionales bacterium]
MNFKIKTTMSVDPIYYLALLICLESFCLGLGFSKASAQSGLPPGDWIINSKTGKPEPFFSDHKRTDFVKGCENSPANAKNLQQLGRFIPTAIMGNDGRCPFFFDENSSQEDKALFGVGEFFDFSRKCKAELGGICGGTGHLVMDGDVLITAAHVFLNHIDGEIDKYSDGKGFKFSTKVWIPRELRKDPDVAYEWRSYEIQEIQYGSLNPREPRHKDYAFVKLKEPVGVSVGKRDANGKIGERVSVDRKYWPKPLAFKPLDDTRFSKKIEMVSLRDENGKIKDSPFYKNCEPFNIYRDPHSDLGPAFKNLLTHNGDMLDRSSGSALAVRDEHGVLTFTAVNVADLLLLPDASETEGDFHIENRVNFAVDGNSFYEEFINFRRKFGRSEPKKNGKAAGAI